MKQFKKIFWGLLLAAPVIIASSGCKKFLDRKPLTATLEDLNAGLLESQIFGMYNSMRGDAGLTTLPWLDFNSIRDDDAQKGSDANDGREIITEFETFQYTKDDWATNTYWNDHFSMINKANNALDDAKVLNLTGDASTRNIGEACFFRAWAYFELVKAYGEVPLINFRIVKPTDGIIAKSSVDAIYAFIDSNLQVAAANLPVTDAEYGSNFDGRLTKGAANTLWAQTKLFRKDWSGVVGLCNQVIASGQYDLAATFPQIWRDGVGGAGKNGVESIWEMQAYTDANAQSNSSVDFGSNWGTCQNVRQNGAPIEWNLGWGWNTPTDKLETEWPNEDPRKRQTILYSGQSDGGPAQGGYGATVAPYTNPDGSGGLAQKYWNKKVYSDPAMRQFTGFINANGSAPWINHRILRYADVLLMLAEASNELNDGATAATMVERVRARARGSNNAVLPAIAFVDQSQMRTAIKNERRWEFAMEGYRFYDLVRWGDAITTLGSLGYTDRCKYYPIPQPAIDISGGVLTQNPDWP